ncbi:hypothetical protein Bca4012_015752 [Brassica carinata]|uniref:Uncharacterized protein n=1 Tax=Brassica carinata TaxID=52824 RepID=A0A8X7TJ43_BRACI|nr:hypothetical protein Bca52824_094260 [Brassica carinata]
MHHSSEFLTSLEALTGAQPVHTFFTANVFNSGIILIGEIQSLMRDLIHHDSSHAPRGGLRVNQPRLPSESLAILPTTNPSPTPSTLTSAPRETDGELQSTTVEVSSKPNKY